MGLPTSLAIPSFAYYSRSLYVGVQCSHGSCRHLSLSPLPKNPPTPPGKLGEEIEVTLLYIKETHLHLPYCKLEGSSPLLQTKEWGDEREDQREREGRETRCLLIKLGKETAGRDSAACGSAFITPLPPDPGAVLGGRARLLGMALLICHSWGKWLLMEGLKWHVENTSPRANAPGPAVCTSPGSVAPRSRPRAFKS